MKKQLSLILLSVFLLSFSLNGIGNNTYSTTSETKVTICTGQYAKRYHKSNKCKGLNNCKGEIKSVALDDAKKKGLTPCKMCYK